MPRYFTEEHEWIDVDGETATIGITDYAQEQLGDIVFVELPAEGTELVKGKEAAVVESVKAASDVYAPIGGTVTEANGALEDDPALVNSAPEGDGWFFRVSVSDSAELDGLMDEAKYKSFCEVCNSMRYLPLTDSDRAAMLDVVGASSIDDLFTDVPEAARLSGPIAGLPLHAGEMAVERHMRRLSKKNLAAADAPFFLGAGAYRHHIPASVDHIIQRGEFLTAYTPYQPEIAQGTLQMLFEFQTQVARLYGCAIANASMYDGSTACWEAVAMAARVTKRKRVVLSGALHPHYAEVVRTMAKFTEDEIAHARPAMQATPDHKGLIERIDGDTSCVVVQYPDILGRVSDLAAIAQAAHDKGALLIVVNTEPVALGAIRSPGEMGADIVVGEGQAIGVGLQFGGPYLGLFAVRDPKHVRQMPGRLCGETVDAEGKRGFVLTLSTREQHIRREKATSNICTNSGLCALAFSVHMTLLGEAGLRRLAAENHRLACKAADRLAQIPGVSVLNETFFNEFTVLLGQNARDVVRKLADDGILAGVSLQRLYAGHAELPEALLVAVTETTSEDDIETMAKALEEVLR